MYIFKAGVHINQCLSECGQYVGHMQMINSTLWVEWVLALVCHICMQQLTQNFTQVFSYKRKYDMIIELILAIY